MAQCELAGQTPRLLDQLFDASFKIRAYERLGGELAERIAAAATRRP